MCTKNSTLRREYSSCTMAKEDILLGLEMGRLEIEPANLNGSRSEENRFDSFVHQKKYAFKRPFMLNCTYTTQKRNKFFGINKKKQTGILKEPVLKILKTCGKNNTDLGGAEIQPFLSKDLQNSTPNINSDTHLCTLVQNCTQLKISSGSNQSNSLVPDGINQTKWWKNDISKTGTGSSVGYKQSLQSSQAGTCSQQALNPPCDVTIDELASYFETLVHIPKKMSSMAEMMYI